MAFVSALWKLFLETRRSSNLYKAFLRAGAACRILFFPSQMKQLKALDFMRNYCFDGNRLFFITHRFYLSKELALAQRIECAVDHYAYEKRNRGPWYHDLVYRSSGLVLWHQIRDGEQ